MRLACPPKLQHLLTAPPRPRQPQRGWTRCGPRGPPRPRSPPAETGRFGGCGLFEAFCSTSRRPSSQMRSRSSTGSFFSSRSTTPSRGLEIQSPPASPTARDGEPEAWQSPGSRCTRLPAVNTTRTQGSPLAVPAVPAPPAVRGAPSRRQGSSPSSMHRAPRPLVERSSASSAQSHTLSSDCLTMHDVV